MLLSLQLYHQPLHPQPVTLKQWHHFWGCWLQKRAGSVQHLQGLELVLGQMGLELELELELGQMGLELELVSVDWMHSMELASVDSMHS